MTIFHDRAEISGRARITPEGYFVADALVARANNIQEYKAGELGLTDRKPDEIVRVFRPESEVFAVDSIKSASRLPLTLGHPPVMVDASNWREYAKGETGEEILRDGEFMRVPLRITDAGAVSRVADDYREFSLGYKADLKLEAGVHDGAAYDASVTNLRYNHLAACQAARGGPELRIVDERPAPAATPIQPKGNAMLVLVDGLQVDVSNAEVAATTVQRLVTARDTANGALEEATSAVAARDATIAERDAEIATLKDAAGKANDPAALRDAAASYARTVRKAKALGVTVGDSDNEAAIRKAVVDAKLGDVAKDYTDAQVDAAFGALTKDISDAEQPGGDPLRAAIGDGLENQGDQVKAFNDARNARLDRYATAYLGEPAATA